MACKPCADPGLQGCPFLLVAFASCLLTMLTRRERKGPTNLPTSPGGHTKTLRDSVHHEVASVLTSSVLNRQMSRYTRTGHECKGIGTGCKVRENWLGSVASGTGLAPAINALLCLHGPNAPCESQVLGLHKPSFKASRPHTPIRFAGVYPIQIASSQFIDHI